MINDLRKDINEYLDNYFKNKGKFNKIIYEASDYSVNIGGKRIRPILFALSYSLSLAHRFKSISFVSNTVKPNLTNISQVETFESIYTFAPNDNN